MSTVNPRTPEENSSELGEILTGAVIALVIAILFVMSFRYAHGEEPTPPKAKPKIEVFTHEGEIRPYGLGSAAANTKAMGKEHPRIIMQGQFLVYDESVNWYRFVSTNYKAYWIPVEVSKTDDPKDIHEMRLMLPVRYDEKAKKFQYLDTMTGQWSDKEPPGAERFKGPILDAEEKNVKDSST